VERTHLPIVQQRHPPPLLDQDVARVGVGLRWRVDNA